MRLYEFWYSGRLVGIVKLTNERALELLTYQRWDLRPCGWQVEELMEA